MADEIKVLIGEKNGIELGYAEEYIINAGTIQYDNTNSDLLATDVKSAIDEISLRSSGFSKRFITVEVVIAATDEMILSDFIDIDENGSLEIDGMLTILGV